MARLVFQAADLRRIVEHTLNSKEHAPRVIDYDRKTFEPITEPGKPGVILVHDQGVYLMSNGRPGDPLDPKQDTSQKFWKHYVAYARGCHPEKDSDWYDTARRLVGGDDFSEFLPWAEQIKKMLDAGAVRIVINFGQRNISMRGEYPTRRQ